MTSPVVLTARGACFKHTQERLLERYGIYINYQEYAHLCQDIASNWPSLRWWPAESSEDRRRIKVKYPLLGKMVIFVFSPAPALIVTAVPRTPRSKPRRKGMAIETDDVRRKAKSKRGKSKYSRHSKQHNKRWQYE